jgi:hypothetical protein
MPLCPSANIRLIDTKFLSGSPIAVFNRQNVHTQAGNGSLYGYYSASGRPSSHAWAGKSGALEQYVDTVLMAEADLDGNDATLSIECEGGEEPYTDPQMDALIRWLTWAQGAHAISGKIAENSFSGSDSSKGLSWHRLGIDGNFPAMPSRYAGRQQRGGGMHYSSAFGKTCPTNVRIDMLFDIVFPAVLGTAPGPGPGPGPTPPPGGIDVDGWWGSGTTRRAQEVAGTVADGEVWGQYKPNAQPAFTTGWVYNYPNPKGSPLIAALQRVWGVDPDGVFGTDTVNGMEIYYGYPPDGRLDGPSNTVKRFQEALNAGRI